MHLNDKMNDTDTHLEDNIASDLLTNLQKQVLGVIISNIDSKSPDNINVNTDFTSIGFDSITFIKTIVALENEFDFEFDDEMILITKFPTVKSMVEYVEAKVT